MFILLLTDPCALSKYTLKGIASIPNSLLLAGVQVLLLGSAEAFRANGEAPGVEGLDKLYPGK